MTPWQPRPKMHVQREQSQVRSARIDVLGVGGVGELDPLAREIEGRPLRLQPAVGWVLDAAPVEQYETATRVGRYAARVSSTSARTPCTCWWSTPTAVRQPTPQLSHKTELRLAERDRRAAATSSEAGADALVEARPSRSREAKELGCDEMLAFATSAVRDARNGAEVLEAGRARRPAST